MLLHFVLLQALITRYHEAVQRTTAKACKKYLNENVFKNVSKVFRNIKLKGGGVLNTSRKMPKRKCENIFYCISISQISLRLPTTEDIVEFLTFSFC